MTDGFLWFVAALVICGSHALHLRGWRREWRAKLRQEQQYDGASRRRHEETLAALTWYPISADALASEFRIERSIPRDTRQLMISLWAKRALGTAEASDLPRRGLRLLEEALRAFQACGGEEASARQLVASTFARPAGTGIARGLGGVALAALCLAAAAGLSAEEEECREIRRVLSSPVRRVAGRNGAGAA